MNKSFFKASVILFFLYAINLKAQVAEPIGAWQTYLSYSVSESVAQDDEKVYFATSQGIYTVDKEELSLDYINKVNGLSDAIIQKIAYSSFDDLLLVAYTNGNIDLRKKDGTVYNIPYLKQSNLVTEKKINNIFFDGKGLAYLSTSFGILALDLGKKEVKFTTFSDAPILSFAQQGDTLYAANSNGVFYINVNNSSINYWPAWTQQIEGVLASGVGVNAICLFQNELIAKSNTYLIRKPVGGVWQNIPRTDGYTGTTYPDFSVGFVNDLSVSADGENLIVSSLDGIYSVGKGNYATYLLPNNDKLNGVKQAVKDLHNRIWYANSSKEAGYFSFDNWSYNLVSPNGPASPKTAEIKLVNDALWVASISTDYVDIPYDGTGVYRLKDQEWTSYNGSIPGFDGSIAHIVVAVHPETGDAYIGTLNDGLYKIKPDGQIVNYNLENTTLRTAGGQPYSPSTDLIRITGLAFDTDNNLWISNHQAPTPINVLKNDGTWAAFSNSNVTVTKSIIDNNGYKWFMMHTGNILVYDSGDDIDSENDDQSIVLSPSNTEMPSSGVLSMTVDLNGDIWVGTDQGVVVFGCASQAFSQGGPCGERVKVTIDNFTDYLLKTEAVTAIAVDGANKKWIGTKNGLFYISEDGKSQLAHYTVENSPLLDNIVNTIAIDGKTGRVFIGTNAGIQSFKGEATTGTKSHIAENVMVYPNPVRPDYTGTIAIKGLVRDANVKITDINGTLVYETQALGGQAVWSGYDYSGKRASTGVYLVFSSNTDGTEKFVTKFVIVN